MYLNWGSIEIKALLDPNNTLDDVCQITGRSRPAILRQAGKFNRKFGTKWNDKKIEKLKLSKLSNKELSKLLNVSIRAIANKKYELGIKKRNCRRWTTNEINVLKLNLDQPTKELSKVLDRTVKSIDLMKIKIRRGDYI